MPPQSRVLSVYLKPNVTRDELLEVFYKAITSTGCPVCGLRGLDLYLRGDRAAEGVESGSRSQIRDLPGVAGVTSEPAR